MKDIKWKIIMEEYLQRAIGEKGAPETGLCPDEEKDIKERDCLNCPNLEDCFENIAAKDPFAPMRL